LAGIDLQIAVHNLRVVGKQAAFGRPRSATSIRVVGASMTWTHKELGLREPPDRAPKVSAIDSKHLKLRSSHSPHPTRDSIGFAVPFTAHWIGEFCQTSLAHREYFDMPKRYPRLVGIILLGRREQVPNDWNSNCETNHSVEARSDLEQ
jgi:hypothetical protein